MTRFLAGVLFLLSLLITLVLRLPWASPFSVLDPIYLALWALFLLRLDERT